VLETDAVKALTGCKFSQQDGRTDVTDSLSIFTLHSGMNSAM